MTDEQPGKKYTYKKRKTLIPIPHRLKNPFLYGGIGVLLATQLATLFIALAAKSEGLQSTMSTAIALISMGLCVMWSIKMCINLRSNEWKKKLNLTVFIQSALLILLLLIITVGLGPLFPSDPQTNQEQLNLLFASQPIAIAIYVGLVAPIVEEAVFREVLPSVFDFHILSYILLTLCFALLHSPNGVIGWVQYGGLAAIFTFARLRAKSVTTSILIHVAWNCFTLIIMFMSMG